MATRRFYVQTLAARPTRLRMYGKYFLLDECPVTLARVTLRKRGTIIADMLPAAAGNEIEPSDWRDESQAFDSIEIETPVDQAIAIWVGDTPGRVNRTEISGSLSVTRPNDIQTSADVAVGTTPILLMGAALTRQRIILTALDTNTDVVRLGETSGVIASFTRGHPLYPGMSFETTNTDAIYGVSPTGGQTVAIWRDYP